MSGVTTNVGKQRPCHFRACPACRGFLTSLGERRIQKLRIGQNALSKEYIFGEAVLVPDFKAKASKGGAMSSRWHRQLERRGFLVKHGVQGIGLRRSAQDRHRAVRIGEDEHVRIGETHAIGLGQTLAAAYRNADLHPGGAHARQRHHKWYPARGPLQSELDGALAGLELCFNRTCVADALHPVTERNADFAQSVVAPHLILVEDSEDDRRQVGLFVDDEGLVLPYRFERLEDGRGLPNQVKLGTRRRSALVIHFYVRITLAKSVGFRETVGAFDGDGEQRVPSTRSLKGLKPARGATSALRSSLPRSSSVKIRRRATLAVPMQSKGTTPLGESRARRATTTSKRHPQLRRGHDKARGLVVLGSAHQTLDRGALPDRVSLVSRSSHSVLATKAAKDFVPTLISFDAFDHEALEAPCVVHGVLTLPCTPPGIKLEAEMVRRASNGLNRHAVVVKGP
eukprot:scaffold2963_cov250-Pinguiococcus_pyrenoidosus.AAC.32